MRRPTIDEWATITRAFDLLLKRPDEQREETLTRQIRDPFIAAQVRSLLKAQGDTGPLDGPAFCVAPANAEYSSLPKGACVGSFTIERLIGRGGMGEVYLARRNAEGFRQSVALKLLRPEAASNSELFLAERALLARLEHPGIARLIDGGLADDSRAFMAMEYVAGQPITEWCTEQDSTLEGRLRLILSVMDAVSYAHARLVVHRDLKPSNVLIDSDGRPRLVDFGIAKLLDKVNGDGVATVALSTPAYAAPEQLDKRETTVATDVYGLGAILYEVLVSHSPWSTTDSTMPLIMRRALQHEPPLMSEITRAASPFPKGKLRGDLDAIVARALRDDPGARYRSVVEFADDLQRYLRKEPVRARSGARIYVLRRFVLRNRWAVASGAVALLAMLGGTMIATIKAHEAAVARDQALAQVKRSEAVNSALTLMFRKAGEAGDGGSTSARALLNASAERLLSSTGNTPNDALVILQIAELFTYVEDPVAVEALLERALQKGIGRDDPVTKARMRLLLGSSKTTIGKLDEALPLLDAAEPVWAREPTRFRRERLEAGAARAQLLRLKGQREQAIALLQTSLPDAEREYAEEPRELLVRYANLAVHLIESNQLKALGALLDRAEAAVTRLQQETTPAALALMQLRGGWLTRLDRFDEAKRLLDKLIRIREASAGPSAAMALDLLALGRVELRLGRTEDALKSLMRSQALAREFVGKESQPAIVATMSLAEAQIEAGQIATAASSMASISPAAERLGPTTSPYGLYLKSRARLRIAEGDASAARVDLDQAERIFQELGPVGQPYARDIPALRKRIQRIKT